MCLIFYQKSTEFDLAFCQESAWW